MFERSALVQLRRWRTNNRRKPLVLRGARQVGKTTLVNQFGKEFTNFLSFNIDREIDKTLFEQQVPFEILIANLFAIRGKHDNGDTLIFIDEIQNSPIAINLLRYFKEDRPDLYVVAAGSLLENIVDVETSFPVGRVEYMALHPCSFREFLVAIGKENLLFFLDNLQVSGAVHTELMALFNQYVIVGGMPEAVQAYAETMDILALDDIYETLIQGYQDDVEKYVRRSKLTEVVRFLIKTSWSKAGQTITLGGFANSEYRAKEIKEGFRLLQRAMLLETIYPTTSTIVPALGEEKRMPKLVMLDSGLTNYQAGIRRELIGATDILDVWKGHLAEQIVAQELISQSTKVSTHRYFWVKSGKTSAEIDFVWVYNSQLYPIEVKAGRNSHLRSLHSFLDTSPINIGIRVWSGPFSIDEVQTTIGKKTFRLVNLPFYLVGSLEKVLDKII